MSDVLRCLAVRQPWAWALVAGVKDIENRSWKTDYRGPIVIQASSSKSVVNSIAKNAKQKLPPMNFDYSALVGVVDLVDIVPLCKELESNPWAWGTQCWRVANARRFREPIPAKGKLNLYTLDAALANQAQTAIAHAEPVSLDDVARQWVEAMTQIFPEQERIRSLLDAYFELRDGHNALRLAEHGVTTWGTADTYIDRAAAKRILGELPDALEDANRALELDPDSAAGYLERSNVFFALSEEDKAIAAEIDPELIAAIDKGMDEEAE